MPSALALDTPARAQKRHTSELAWDCRDEYSTELRDVRMVQGRRIG